MTDEPRRPQTGRMDNLAPGVPVAAKIALLLGLAGGLFVTIILSYTDPDRQFWGIGVGLAAGLLAAIFVSVRAKRRDHNPN
jgi:membrane associated rhomboid family serine protease